MHKKDYTILSAIALVFDGLISHIKLFSLLKLIKLTSKNPTI